MSLLPAPLNPDLAAQAAARQDFLREAADLGEPRMRGYAVYRNYCEGEQRALLSDRAQAYLRRTHLPWSENFCETIVDVLVQSLHVLGFICEDSSDDDAPEDGAPADTQTDAEALADALRDWWQQNQMDAKESTLYDHASVEGDAFVIVDYDQERQRPRFTVQNPYTMKVVYSDDDPDCMLYAVKVWNTRFLPSTDPEDIATSDPVPIRRMNLYWPDRVEKWFTTEADGASAANWHPWMDEGETGWPVMMVGHDGKPLECAVHFRPKARGRQYGRSDLHSVIPQQDGLNKAILDLNAIMDYDGVPSRWVSGVQDVSGLKVAPGEVWSAPTADARFGQFDIPNIAPVLDAISAALSRMSARSSTPMHLLNPTGALPSGESLKVADAPRVAKAESRQLDHGNSHERMMRLAVRWHNTFAPAGAPRFDEDMQILTQWDDPQSRNDESEARTADIWHGLGVSKSTLMAKAGFNPEEEREKRMEEDAEAMDRGALGGGLPQDAAPALTPGRTEPADPPDPATLPA